MYEHHHNHDLARRWGHSVNSSSSICKGGLTVRRAPARSSAGFLVLLPPFHSPNSWSLHHDHEELPHMKSFCSPYRHVIVVSVTYPGYAC